MCNDVDLDDPFSNGDCDNGVSADGDYGDSGDGGVEYREWCN